MLMGSNLAEDNDNLCMPSFRGEVKLLVTCKIYSMLKIPSKYEQRYFVRLNSSLPLPVCPALLLDDYAGRITAALQMDQEFSPVDIIPPWFSMLTYYQDEQQARWWPQFSDRVSPH
jgi:hypothetical protein